MAALLGAVALTNAEKSARYDTKHRVERSNAARHRYATHPEKVYAANQKWLRVNPARRLLQIARRRAKLHSLNFGLTETDISLPSLCPVLGVELIYNGKGFNPNAASLDRIDNSKGYIRGNVAVISRRANIMKSDGTADEHEAIASWMKRMQVR